MLERERERGREIFRRFIFVLSPISSSSSSSSYSSSSSLRAGFVWVTVGKRVKMFVCDCMCVADKVDTGE